MDEVCKRVVAKGRVLVWLSSMCKERSELCQCTQMIGGCWAYSGEALSVDKVLPFGLRSANAIVDAQMWASSMMPTS